MKVISKYYLIFGVAVLLMAPHLNKVLHFVDNTRADENRAFTDSIVIDINHLDRLPNNVNEYVNDNFGLRKVSLGLYNQLKLDVFKSSPFPSKTLIGKDQWCFLPNNEKKIVEGRAMFSAEQLNSFKTEWNVRTQFLDSLNIPCYWVIAPLKHYVYDDKLPINVNLSDKRRVDQLKTYMNAEYPNLIIDPLDALKQAKKEGEKLYYKYDNHWNYTAGKVVSNMLMEKISTHYPNLVWDDTHYKLQDSILKRGWHYRVLNDTNLFEHETFPKLSTTTTSYEAEKYNFPITKHFDYEHEFERRFKNDSSKNDLKILVIRDSFGKQLMPYLREYFKESVFIFDAWQYNLNPNIIQAIKPDVVVFLNVESLLEHYID